MKQTTLCFLRKEDGVLLAMKKRGFGIGKWNGVGGKVKEGESIEDAAVREVQEEIGVTISTRDLRAMGTLHFRFENHPDWEQTCNIFIIHRWEGEPSESEEMRPQWYREEAIPFDLMWVDDIHWLPLVLNEKKIKGSFTFSEDTASMLECEVLEI